MSTLHEVIEKGKALNDSILTKTLQKIERNYDGFNFKETAQKLEVAFNDATYRKVENAIELEFECKDILYK